MFELTLRCTVCGTETRDPTQKTCSACGPWGILAVERPLASPTEGPGVGIRRFLPLLPIPDNMTLPLPPVGDTPLVEAPRLAWELGLKRLRLKDDGRNPSGSLKDRASWVGAVLANGRTAACASTGNAASSLAAMCAALGTKAVIFVPARAPVPKVAQLQVFGAKVFRVQGSYDQAYDLCAQAIERFGWYDRNAAVNPMLVEGKKTCGLELGEAEEADWVAVSVGDGCTIAAIWKGLQEMYQLGTLSRLPRLLGVQAERSPAVYDEWAAGGDAGPARAPKGAVAETLADSISVGVPRNWRRAVQAVRASGGEMILVSDDEIDAAMRDTARFGGVYGEPAGVTAVAGLRKAHLGGSAIAVVTGSGLKDVVGAQRAGGEPIDVSPDLGEIERHFDQQGGR
jgi:threonine synthase